MFKSQAHTDNQDLDLSSGCQRLTKTQGNTQAWSRWVAASASMKSQPTSLHVKYLY